MTVTHEDLRAGRLNIYKLTGREAQDIVAEYDAVVAERDRLAAEVRSFMKWRDALPSLLNSSETPNSSLRDGLVRAEFNPAPPDINTLSDSSRGVESAPLPLDFSKPVRTRGGRKVRILHHSAPCTQPIVGVIDGVDFVCQWFVDGRYYEGTRERDDDLVQDVPPPRATDCWVVAKIDDDGEWKITGFKTKESADLYYTNPICRIRVRLVEGQFDV